MRKFKICFWLISLVTFSHLQSAELQPFARHQKLQVKNHQLANQQGEAIQLRGMSTHGLQWHGWGKSLSSKSLDVLAYDWKADVLRLAMYYDEGGYKTNPKRFTAMMDTLIEENHKRGLYSIVDWHVLKPGDPWMRIDEAKKFFAYIAKKHGKKGSVLYEICNEPNGKGVDWKRIKSYAEQVIPIIRKHDPDGIILVGTPAWASLGISDGKLATGILSNPLKGDLAHNLMYSVHFYGASHKQDYRDGFLKFAGKVPLFITEWGSQQASGEGAHDWQSVKEWHKILDQHKISWCYWNYSDGWRTGPVWKRGTLPHGPFGDDRLKESGREVKKLIQKKR